MIRDPLLRRDGGKGRPRSVIDNLLLLRAFAAVVEGGSFSQAGRRLRVVPSTVSKYISFLESRLRGQLVVRSTKQLSITELGQRFYAHCVAILGEVERAETEIGEYNAEPQGILKISAATVFTVKHMAPTLVRFLDKYPKVQMEISLTTSTEDLIAKGIDVAIRITNELAPGLIAVPLLPSYRVYCAAPAYLERHGVPKLAAELAHHNCLVVRGVTESSSWPIRRPDGQIERVHVSGNFVSDNGELVRQALVCGLGIGHLALFMVHEHLAKGELVELFPESRSVASHVYAVYADRRNMPLKTRAFIDHLRTEFREPPAWAR